MAPAVAVAWPHRRCAVPGPGGMPWRDVPDRYGPGWRLYGLFACWQLLVVWERIEHALIQAADSAGKVDWNVSVDSTTARAHVHAAGARQDRSQRIDDEPDHHALGRSRAAGRPRFTWPASRIGTL